MSQTPKKIVSKGQYAKAQGKKFWLYSNVVLSFTYMPCYCYTLFGKHLPHSTASYFLYGGVWLLFLKSSITHARKHLADARDIAVLPLTRANTGDLPADTSLVRASEPPVTPQEDVLLRPAMESQESHKEQLLRPS